MSETALLDVDQRGVATLTLNRPEVHNAFDDQMICGLTDQLRRLGGDPECRVVVLTGQGSSFSAGADLKLFADGDPETAAKSADGTGNAQDQNAVGRGREECRPREPVTGRGSPVGQDVSASDARISTTVAAMIPLTVPKISDAVINGGTRPNRAVWGMNNV